MTYLTPQEYKDMKGVAKVPDNQLPDLLELASDLVDSIVQCPVPTPITEDIRKAVAYQVSMLFAQGGIGATLGFSSENFSGESLGDYSYSKGSGGSGGGGSSTPSFSGIPIAPLTINFLRKAGLLRRWVHACREGCNNA